MSRSDGLKKRMEERRARLPRLVYPPALPILEKRAEIVAAIRKHPVVVITGETGSGKTTQIPKMCLEAGRGLAGLIGCTQPRRIAATTVARRIAEEMGEEVGRSVGYKIRFADRTSRDAFLKIMTDGILLVEAQSDPRLRAYDTIIVDEAHERSLNIDFILGILKNLLGRRPDLRIVITSATIDTEKFSRAFAGAPVIEVSGRLYTVEVRYEPLDRDLEEKGEMTHVDAAVQAVEEIVRRREPGDILIFMPTEQDIRETCGILAGRLREGAAVLPLFSRLTGSEQQRVFQPLAKRKIVVATNVAETSLTIPGIRYVIDTGLARISQYNPRSRTAALPVRAVSRSSADQRKGRCGRVQNGICIRLYAEEDYLARPLFTQPEILRSNLAGVILQMLALDLGDIQAFPFIDPPSPKGVRDGIDILLELGAIEAAKKEEGNAKQPWSLSERGRIMARLPLDPRVSRMVIEARREGCLAEVVVIAAALSIQDPRERPAGKEAEADRIHAPLKDPASDFVALLNMWERVREVAESHGSENRVRRFCREHLLSYRRMREWRDVHDQLLAILAGQKLLPKTPPAPKKEGAELYAAIHRSILSGYLGHIAVKKEKNLYTAAQGRQAMLFPGSGLFNRGGRWIVAAEMVETTRLFARTAANIDSGWLEELGGALCRRTYFSPHWEKDRGEVVASEQVTLFGLTIVEARPVSFGRIDPEAASRIFIRSALVEGEVKRPLPFLAHNLALIEKIAGLEEKVRRHDLLVSEEAMAEFYEKRIHGICDIRTLQRLVRDRGDDDFLRMREADLLCRPPDPDEIALFPETVSAGGWRLACLYRFAPGKPEDGVTLKIPAQAAPSVSTALLDWAVPGLLREKVIALLKGLPKEYRKRLQPLAQTSDIVLAEMDREGLLLTALGRFIYRRFGVDIPGDRWPLAALNAHLKLRFAVVDDKGRELAAGRDIDVLKKGFVGAEETQVFARTRRQWERSGLTVWDFGDLPESIPLSGAGEPESVAYPGLEAAAGGIRIRLFLSASEAGCAHRQGVKALFALHFREELRHLRKGLAPAGDLKLWAAAFGGAKVLENALFEKVVYDLFSADIRTKEAFAAHAEEVRSRILLRGQEIVRMAVPPLKALYETAELLRTIEASNRGNRPVLAFLSGLQEELAELFPTDFLIRYDEERIGHIGRYLRALAIRAQRGAVHLEKALVRGEEIRQLHERREEILRGLPPHASEEKRQAIDEMRWMIEEYKVSLFAQELKTAFPVSRKRLEARFGEIDRML
ncbi:MAG: ATP-dependent RNA helicase HrpA [Proteobacteria bacterium]|nr:ATP-dependent RNA helicase HrpA [Pseudomonadota bacterium]